MDKAVKSIHRDLQIRLSICITVYNQSQLLKKNLENLLRYPSDDIQIVVSDNCSEDDLQSLCNSFHDSRIKYCRTSENVGQDLNIVNAFKNCDSQYAFLLRTSDTLIPEKIDRMLGEVAAHPDAAFWQFASINEAGEHTGYSPNRIYPKGNKALHAHFCELTNHPSGELYNLNCFSDQDFEKYARYIKKHFTDNSAFIITDLMRMDLAAQYDFASSSYIAWVYHSINRDDVAVNSTHTKSSGWSPIDNYPRYQSEVDFVIHEIPPEFQTMVLKRLIGVYCQLITNSFKYYNKDKRLLRHYAAEEEEFSAMAECKRFYRFTRGLLEGLPAKQQRQLQPHLLFCLTAMQPRWTASHYLGPLIKVKLYGRLVNIAKGGKKST